MHSETGFESGLVENLRRHVDQLAGLIGPRHLGPSQSMAAAATLIERQLVRSGYEVNRERYVAQGQDVANVIAEVPGTSRAEDVVILGAHYDTVRGSPGADDNASAVAILLEVARLMHSCRPERTLRFVAFACEESPHFYTHEMGSQVHAKLCRERRERIVGMLCLEMVGFYSSAPASQAVPVTIPKFLRWVFPRRGDFLAAVGNLASWKLLWKFRWGFKSTVRFPLFSVCLPEAVQEIRRSDHSSFWDQGYPALLLTDTSFLRNPNYHRPTDTPETLDYERMAKVAMGVLGGIAKLARAEWSK